MCCVVMYIMYSVFVAKHTDVNTNCCHRENNQTAFTIGSVVEPRPDFTVGSVVEPHWENNKPAFTTDSVIDGRLQVVCEVLIFLGRSLSWDGRNIETMCRCRIVCCMNDDGMAAGGGGWSCTLICGWSWFVVS
jgi:hypothetical protein